MTMTGKRNINSKINEQKCSICQSLSVKDDSHCFKVSESTGSCEIARLAEKSAKDWVPIHCLTYYLSPKRQTRNYPGSISVSKLQDSYSIGFSIIIFLQGTFVALFPRNILFSYIEIYGEFPHKCINVSWCHWWPILTCAWHPFTGHILQAVKNQEGSWPASAGG